jgi:surface polysaccharide O-acyltransferase-like enzyme
MRLKSVPPKRQFHGIDWIRAVASVAVVALHYHAIPSGLTSGPDADAVWQIVNGYLLRLAVPLFLMVSLFLLSNDRADQGAFRKSYQRLALYALVWPVLFYVSNGGLPGYLNMLAVAAKETVLSPGRGMHYLLTGQETVFYFFVSLMIAQFFLWCLRLRSNGVVLSAMFASMAVVALLSLVPFERLAVFYNPLNFLPYAPCALLLRRFLSQPASRAAMLGVCLFSVGCGIGALEFWYSNRLSPDVIDGYTRISLVFLAAGAVALTFNVRRPPLIVRFMSAYSLPLYLLHTCLYAVVGTLCNLLFVKALHAEPTHLHAYAWLVAIGLSYAVAKWVAPTVLHPTLYAKQ